MTVAGEPRLVDTGSLSSHQLPVPVADRFKVGQRRHRPDLETGFLQAPAGAAEVTQAGFRGVL